MTLVLDDPERLAALDPAGMLDCVRRLPDQASDAFRRARTVTLPNPAPRQVVIAGMGGSAISGDLARTLLYGTCRVPVSVSRHCALPAFLGPEDLAILLSYSGNTAETLGCLYDAIARRIPCVLVTSGGQFQAIAEQHGFPVVSLPGGWMPRAALGDLYFSLLGLLSQLPGAEWIDPAPAIEALRADRSVLDATVPTERNHAKQLAMRLYGKTPMLFGVTPTTEAVTQRWKAQFNENSKVTAIANAFPELTHNEIVNVAHRRHADHVMVILRDPTDPELLQRQLGFARDLMAPQVDEVIELVAEGADPLTRQLRLVYLGDWVSVYLALLDGVDPTPVEAIFGLKARMAQAQPQGVR